MDKRGLWIGGDGFSIRPAGEQDADAVLAVYERCADFLSICPVPVASMEMVLDDLRHSREMKGVFCGIYVGGEMAGVADFVPDNFEGEPGVAFINLLMIAKEHRGKGLGRKVVEAIESEILKNPAITEIRLGAQVDNVNGVAFWKRMGYEITGGPKVLPDTTVCYDFSKAVTQAAAHEI